MSEIVSSTLTQALEALPHFTWVIDSTGVIQFVSSSWIAYSEEYELFSGKDCVGTNGCELLQKLIGESSPQTTSLESSLQHIFQGQNLVFHTELQIKTLKKGNRTLQLEAFPLMIDFISEHRRFIISLKDLGSVSGRRHIQLARRYRKSQLHPFNLKLIPICASCKSIRNDKEQWLRIEEFLKEKLSVQFTHDICPDCIRRLYPKYADVLKNSHDK